jgi:hypothetical protein
MNGSRYPYRNLTSAVSDKQSPLRRYLETRFPHTRALQDEYKQHAGPLLVDGGRAAAGTVGGAFDFMVRFRLDPTYSAEIARVGFRLACRVQGAQEQPKVLAAVMTAASRAAADARSGGVADSRTRSLAQACWVLALCTEFYRAGPEISSPLTPMLANRRLKARALMELAPAQALDQLLALDAVAERVLLPQLDQPGRLVLGPSFDGSRFCSADADLIHQGLLVELKTGLGSLSPKTGTRYDMLKREHLYQLVSYVLFDRSDAYALDSMGSIRHATASSSVGPWAKRWTRWPASQWTW